MNNTWIIGIGGSDMDDVKTYLVSGTEEQVKQHLVNLILEDRKTIETESGESFEYGSESIEEIDTFGGHTHFYGSAVYSESHRDYSATLVQNVTEL